jgi:putative phosphoesterase
LSIYPTVDDEVHVVTEDDLAKIYAPSGSSAVCIGTHSASESLAATLDLDKLVTRHGAILGSTGAGKSNTVAAILKAITSGSLPKAQVIVIDPHGEYGAAFKGISRVFSIGAKDHPFLLPYWCLSFDELGWFLVDRRSASETMQDGNLRDKTFDMRQQAAAIAKVGNKQNKLTSDEITVDSPLPFDVKKLWYHFDRLERVAPVTAIRGNVDRGEWAHEYPDTKLVRLAGKSIYVLHDLKTLQADPGAGIDVIVSGHSHVPKIDTVGGVLYLNPGSAGPRRFKLPITFATLEVTSEGIRPEIHDLGGD